MDTANVLFLVMGLFILPLSMVFYQSVVTLLGEERRVKYFLPSYLSNIWGEGSLLASRIMSTEMSWRKLIPVFILGNLIFVLPTWVLYGAIWVDPVYDWVQGLWYAIGVAISSGLFQLLMFRRMMFQLVGAADKAA